MIPLGNDMKYKVISTQLSHLQSYVGEVGKFKGTKDSESLTYYCLEFKNTLAWFLKDEIKKEK